MLVIQFWRVKRDMIQLKLQKKVDEFWPSLYLCNGVLCAIAEVRSRKANPMEANMIQGIKDKKYNTGNC